MLRVKMFVWFCLGLVALDLGATRNVNANEIATAPVQPNFDASELKLMFAAFVQNQIEEEARAGNYSAHQRERTGAFSVDYMLVTVKGMFAEPMPGMRRQIAAYRAELAGYLVLVLQSEFSVENRRLLALSVPAEEVGEVLLLVSEAGIGLSSAALQGTAELVLALHRDPVWRAAVAEKRFPEIAVREFITSRNAQMAASR